MKRAALFELMTILVLLVIGFASRIVPHTWNVTFVLPVMVAVGFLLRTSAVKWVAQYSAIIGILLSVVLMFASDLILGLHETVLFVYLGVAAAALFGFGAGKLPLKGLSAGLLASAAFFLISNFGVWMMSGLYPVSAAGLKDCFLMAIPFFRYQVLFDSVVGGLAVLGLRSFHEVRVGLTYGK